MKLKLLICLLCGSLFLCGCSKSAEKRNKTVKSDNEITLDANVESEEGQVKISEENQNDLNTGESKKDKSSTTSSSVSNKKTSTSSQKNESSKTNKKETSSTTTSSSASKNESNKKPSSSTSTTSKPEVKPEQPSTPETKPQEPEVCKQCINKNLPCDAIIDSTVYREVFSTESAANQKGYYYLNEVEEINGLEITNFSVQPIYNNHGIAVSYGLELWSNGILIP